AAKALDAEPLAQLRRYEAIARTFDGLTTLDDIRAKVAALSSSAAVAQARKDEKRDDELEASYRMRIPTAINGFLYAETPQPAAVLAHDLDLDHLQKLATEQSSR